MKFFSKGKDGGPESKVTGYWLCEIKPLFSIVLLKFDEGSREVYHEHAFNAVSWVLKGHIKEVLFNGTEIDYKASLDPIYTAKDRLHQVFGIAKNTWVLSFRGPWDNFWTEIDYKGNTTTLTHGRVPHNRDVN